MRAPLVAKEGHDSFIPVFSSTDRRQGPLPPHPTTTQARSTTHGSRDRPSLPWDTGAQMG